MILFYSLRAFSLYVFVSLLAYVYGSSSSGEQDVMTPLYCGCYWWLLLSKWELNSYTLLHCSPHMLHFQGLLSQWQPLCKKYKVSSGNSMPQNRQVRICLRFIPPESLSGPVEVIVPLHMGVAVDEVAAPLVGVKLLCITLLFSKEAALRVMRLLALAHIRRFRSSRNSDFSGDTCNDF